MREAYNQFLPDAGLWYSETPSEISLIPARAGSNAVADLQRRYIRAGTSHFKYIIYIREH